MNTSPSSETVTYDAAKLGGLRRRVPHPRLANFKGRQAAPFTGVKKKQAASMRSHMLGLRGGRGY